MNYQEERMKDLIGSLPQNRNVEWDSVAPVIDFEFSRNADPVRARRKNIKRAVKTPKPVRRSIGFFGYKHNKPYQCVVTGVDCRNQDYGDLRKEFLTDEFGRPAKFTPWTGVVPGKGRPMNGTYCLRHFNCSNFSASGWSRKSARTSVASSAKCSARVFRLSPSRSRKRSPRRLWRPSGLTLSSKPRKTAFLL